MKFMNGFKALLFLTFFCGAFCSCRVTGQVSQKAVNAFLNDTAVRTGHAGISIYDLSSKKYLYNYNSEKNFLPSSNVKLFTLYAGMKYLGDSLAGLNVLEKDDTTFFQATGDPTFLHRDFSDQPAIAYLKGKKSLLVNTLNLKDDFSKYGDGWAWEDYKEDFMPERSRFPVYGNVVTFYKEKNRINAVPDFFKKPFFDEPLIRYTSQKYYKISRRSEWNRFYLTSDADTFKFQQVPFVTDGDIHRFTLPLSLLADTLGIQADAIKECSYANLKWKKVCSRPVDSLFRPMMFNSDNFFAEQTLLMVSNEKLGYMSDEQIIDTLLKTDLKDIPTRPRWVDGSGLSRYDLFSPKDFIYILNKLQSDFGLARMKRILPTGGQGTLTNYYESDAGFIYAKTGSMSNNVALSGYLITKKNKVLLFSVIINNFGGTGKSGRRAIEKLLKEVRSSN